MKPFLTQLCCLICHFTTFRMKAEKEEKDKWKINISSKLFSKIPNEFSLITLELWCFSFYVFDLRCVRKLLSLLRSSWNPKSWLRMSAAKKLKEKLCNNFEELRQQIVERFDQIPLLLYLQANLVKQEHSLLKFWHTLLLGFYRILKHYF